MADFLEDSEQNDRNICQTDFLADQFEKFTHDYREKTEPKCCAETDSDHSKCEQAEGKSKRAKKEIVNVTRKLQKALISLEMMPNASDLLIALRDINSQLRDVIVKQNSEFSTSTIPLPEYDTVDMQALLGTEEVAPQKSLLELVKEDQQRVQTNLDRILAEAEILLQEYDHMKNGLKI